MNNPGKSRRAPARPLPAGILFAALLLCAAAGWTQTAAPQPDSRQTALQLEKHGSNAEAEAAWRAYLDAHPASAEAYAHLGLLQARQERYQDAVVSYRKALALHATVPGVRLNLGLALFKAGQMKDAVHEFLPLYQRAPAASPDRQRLAILVGMSYYGAGQFAPAVPYLKQAAAHDSSNLALRLTLAHSCLWSKQYQCVMDTYHEILTLNAESAEADMLAGEALDEMKDAAGAIEQFRAAVKADPRMPDAHFGLGYLLWTKRQYPEAAPEFEAELNLNPHHAQALTYLGDVDRRLSRPDEAIQMLSKAIQIDPSIELAHLDLGEIHAEAGRRDDALREFEVAAKIAPNDVNVHWRLGRLYRTMGRQQEAKAEFARASSITEAADNALIKRMNPPSTPEAPDGSK